MKTTMMFRPIANPRRIRLAALTDAESQSQAAQNTEVAKAEETEAQSLPLQTANPRRTVLFELPAGAVGTE